MFKTLIGTFLLCTSLGAYKPKENVYNSMTLRGAYCFKEDLEYGSDLDNVTLNINHQNHDILICGVNNGYLNYYELGTLYIGVEDINSVSLTIYEYDNAFGVSIDSFPNGEALWSMEDYAEYISEEFYENFVIYFVNDYVLTGKQCELFNAFFTKSGNRYVHNYNGWYNYTGNFKSNNQFTIVGNFVVNNNYVDTYIHNSTDIFYHIERYDYGNTEYYSENYYRYQNGTYTQLGNIQINALIPDFAYNAMAYEGVFQYINDVPNTSFSEMIFSVMDAPLYYLTSLFSFELFGVNMFVAFSSIITLVVVMVIIRKVI